MTQNDSTTEYSNIKIKGPLGNAVQLTKEQAACVNYKSEKTQLAVKGAAGSGKSLVLMAKAKSYMRNYAPGKQNNLVLFSYTNSLINYAKEFLDPDGSKSNYVTITTLNSYLSDIYEEMKQLDLPDYPSARPTYDKKTLKNVLQNVLQNNSRISKHRFYYGVNYRRNEQVLDLLLEEIEYMAGLGITVNDKERYLAMERKGRGRTGIKQSDRDEVFFIYKQFVLSTEVYGWTSWELIYLYIEKNKKLIPERFKFDHVMVDEAQDLPLTVMRIAISLMKQDVLIAMDANQRIYNRHWTMGNLGIPTTSRYLKKSFRCTRQIDDFAECLRMINEDRLDKDDLSRHISPEIDGNLPIVIKYDTVEKEYAYIIDFLKIFINNPRLRTAIIVRTNVEVEKWCELLSDAKIMHVKIAGKWNEYNRNNSVCQYTKNSDTRISLPGVKVCTIHSAKGLEFHNVIMPHFDYDKYPPLYLLRDSEANNGELTAHYRNLSYVAMTRARANLIVSFVGTPSFYLEEIDRELYDYYDCSGSGNFSTYDRLSFAISNCLDSVNDGSATTVGITENYGPDSDNVLTEGLAKDMSSDSLLDYERGRYEYHLRRANRGHRDSAQIVATTLEEGRVVEKDINRLLKIYEDLASCSDRIAMESSYKLGISFLRGIPGSLEPNMSKATHWLDISAKKGYEPAIKDLVKCYDGSYGITDKELLFEALFIKAKLGDKEITKTLLNSEITDYRRYLDLLELSAEQGNVESSYLLGKILKENKEYENPEESFNKMSAAADKGHLDAMCELALDFFEGYGIEKNCSSGRAWLVKATGEEYPRAYYILGRSLYQSWGEKTDFDSAKNYLRLALEKGYEEASQCLNEVESIVFRKEYPVSLHGYDLFFEDNSFALTNPGEAKVLFETAAQKGSDNAKVNLAKLKLGGTEELLKKTLSSDETESIIKIKEAIDLLKSASANNNPAAIYLLCKLMDMGIFSDENYTNGNEDRHLSIACNDDILDSKIIYMRLVDKGLLGNRAKNLAFSYAKELSLVNPEAAYHLSHFYKNGVGAKNPVIALGLLKFAKDTGYPVDDQELIEFSSNVEDHVFVDDDYRDGFIFKSGSPPMEKPKEYFEQFSKDADNHVDAQINLAICYYHGIGIDKNVKTAKYWLKKALGSNSPKANYAAHCYLTENKSSRQTNYLNIAANAGYFPAMNTLAEVLENSDDLNNNKKAFDLYFKLALSGYAPAFYKLGQYFEEGKYIQRNPKQAYRWYHKASNYCNSPKVQSGCERVRNELIKAGVNVDEL